MSDYKEKQQKLNHLRNQYCQNYLNGIDDDKLLSSIIELDKEIKLIDSKDKSFNKNSILGNYSRSLDSYKLADVTKSKYHK